MRWQLTSLSLVYMSDPGFDQHETGAAILPYGLLHVGSKSATPECRYLHACTATGCQTLQYFTELVHKVSVSGMVVWLSRLS